MQKPDFQFACDVILLLGGIIGLLILLVFLLCGLVILASLL